MGGLLCILVAVLWVAREEFESGSHGDSPPSVGHVVMSDKAQGESDGTRFLAPADPFPPVSLTAVKTPNMGDGQASGRALSSLPGLLSEPQPLTGTSLVYASPDVQSGANGTKGSPVSLEQALLDARPGTVIHLASGNYATVVITTAFHGTVTITGAGDTWEPRVAGVVIDGAAHLVLSEIFVTSGVVVEARSGEAGDVATDIAFRDLTVDCRARSTTPNGPALGDGFLVRGGVSELSLDDVYVHNCVSGFATVDGPEPLRHLSIIHSVIQDDLLDGMDLGNVRGAVIEHDIIRGENLPGATLHHDGIQFYGEDDDVVIADDVLANSRNQLILVQDAIATAGASPINHNVVIDNNLIYGAGSIAVQVQGTQSVRITHNTMWDNYYGSLLFRRSSYTMLVPTNVVVKQNVISGIETYEADIPVNSSLNVFRDPASNYARSSCDLVANKVDFVDATSGDFSLHRVPSGYAAVNRRCGSRHGGVAGVPGYNFGRGRISFGAPQFEHTGGKY
jgi:hypothetical protein